MKKYLIALIAFLVFVAPLSAQMKMEAGEYQGVHRHWTDKVIINADGTYKRASNNDPGTYTFDGKTLVLKWAKWPAETLVMTSPGVFSSSAYQFTLTRATAATVTLANPFVNGATYTWNTSAGQDGTVLVTAVNGPKFNLDQINFKNRGAGTTKLDGEVKDGKIYIYNRQWNETWVGDLSGDKISGKINNRFDFNIILTAQPAATVTLANPFVNGATYTWNTSAGQDGTVLVTAVNGPKFNLDQINFKNRGAGTTKLDGEVKDGKIYIYNRQWNETWVGDLSGNKISGKINNRFDFNIILTAQAAATAATAPFIQGKTLKWNTSAGQDGTILVTSVSGLKFNLDQVNFKNRGAGTTKLDGEVKDGQIFIYNRQWRETWVGTVSGGTVTGKINNRFNFTISE